MVQSFFIGNTTNAPLRGFSGQQSNKQLNLTDEDWQAGRQTSLLHTITLKWSDQELPGTNPLGDERGTNSRTPDFKCGAQTHLPRFSCEEASCFSWLNCLLLHSISFSKVTETPLTNNGHSHDFTHPYNNIS